METAYPTGNAYTFNNLAAGEAYVCDILATENGIEGKKYHIEFTTIPDLTSYSLIAIPRNPFRVGEELRLTIINTKSEPKQQIWKYDGQEYDGSSIIFTSRGRHSLQVSYTMDGVSWEYLEKTITVE
jgi:hypothetical protein